MGIDVFMFCPTCCAFLPLSWRDPGLTDCDVEGEQDWGDGAFSVSAEDVVTHFLTHTDFFPPAPTSPYEEGLRRLVQQFTIDHAHEEGKVFFTSSYGIYMWEPGEDYQQADWWRYEAVVVSDPELPNEMPATAWTFLPSHIVKHLGYASFDEALNYFLHERSMAAPREARELPYFRQFYEAVVRWRAEPVAGGLRPAVAPPLVSLVDHCVEAVRTCRPEQLSALNAAAQLPDHLARRIWHALAQTSDAEIERLPDQDFDSIALARYLNLAHMFARSLAQLEVTPTVLDLLCNDEVLNTLIIRMVARPDCALDQALEVSLAGNDWEQDSTESTWAPSLCALRSLTMVLVRCLRPQMTRWRLVGCGALTDDFLLPLAAIDAGPFWEDLIDPDGEDPRAGGLRRARLNPEDQALVKALVKEAADVIDLNGPYALEELDVSDCHRLTDAATHHLHRLFPRLAHLHLNDLTFLPFHSVPSTAALRLECLVELNMAAAYYEHPQKRDEAYFARLAAICPRLEALNVAFWDLTDAELAQIAAHFPRLRRLNVIRSPRLTTQVGLAALAALSLDEVNVGGCTGLTALTGLEAVRCVKAVGATGLGKAPLFAPAATEVAVAELDLTGVRDLNEAGFLEVLARATALQRINVNQCFCVAKETLVQADKDHPHLYIASGGSY